MLIIDLLVEHFKHIISCMILKLFPTILCLPSHHDLNQNIEMLIEDTIYYSLQIWKDKLK